MKAIMVALLACVLVPVLALAQEGQAPAQGNLNTITSVNVKGATVEIVGTRKPNFTTFTMTDPPRLVIDISEAVFSGVKEDISVGNGTISAIRTASYGTDESAIARVLIGYERELETDIQATGNSLVVSVAGGGGTAVAERPGAAPGTAPAAADTAPGGTPDEAAVAAQAERQQQEKAAAQSAASAQVERQQQEKAVAQSAASAQADAEAQRQARARAEAERKVQEESAQAAAQQAEQQRLQQERAQKEATAAAEKQRQQAEEKARREAEAQASAEARKLQREEAQAAAEERRRQQAEARQARIARAETPRRAAPEQGDSADVSSRRKTMMLVGFRQEAKASRVFVRTNEPVRYTVTEGNREVVLELENTRIEETNNTRPLDTSFFDTAVASVDANAGPSRTVRVAIKLKEQVPYQTHQEGNEVSIEFQRPAPRGP
ncbi:AMIN domain-containing protein [Archangium sp.]|uniref:AMIN domain-containing protein n=1 Tax=Archangium sp. TaxID=1872627 RepID=UPI002D5E4D35|nr:AMIN domain-containing protein [Archangium sp.]HYO55077.1 AMIN domain-containing protein [Archangium sp.]